MGKIDKGGTGQLSLVKGIFLLLFWIGLSGQALSQQFSGNPASVRWMQINTDTLRLIFPNGWKGDADRLVALAAHIRKTTRDLGQRSRKINIVLQHQTTYSNAYVGLGPRRSEFFLTPPQNSFELGSLNWPEQLMLHEYRHVQQYDNFQVGLSKLFSLLGGELGFGLIANTAIPNWFWEGDAVVQETLLSQQGRGRLPYFQNGFRSLWSSGKDYSWLKLRNGSLRDYVPDHYQLGYLLTGYARQKWGDTIWAKITGDALRFKSLFYPFQHAVKRNLDMNYSRFQEDALHFFKDSLLRQDDHYSNMARSTRHFAGDEEYPFFIDSGRVLYVKSSYSVIPSFRVRDLRTGADRWVRNKDISLDNYFSFRNGKVVYSALAFDPRWDWRNYGEIRLMDLSTGVQQKVTKKTHYFSPDIDSSGDRIVAVSVDPDGTNQLHLIRVFSGEKIAVLPNPENYFYTCPKFMGSHQVVSPVRNTEGKMALLRVDLRTGEKEQLTPFSFYVIGYPAVTHDTLFVTVSGGQQDRMMRIGPDGAYWFRPVQENKHTGSYALNWYNGKMAWTNFTSVGYRLNWQNEQPGSWEKLDSGFWSQPLPISGLAFLQARQPLPALDEVKYNRVPYPKTHGLVHFHSWLPAVSDADNSLQFLTDNILNTLSGSVELTYNTNEQSKKIAVAGIYGGWYPLLRFSAARTVDRNFLRRGNKVYWDETEWRAGTALPLNLSGGRHYAFMNTGFDYVQVDPEFKGRYKDSFNTNPYGYAQFSVSLGRQVQQARQHIYPRWAQEFRLSYKKAVTRLQGQQLTLNLNSYTPGLLTNHHLVLQTAWQTHDTLRQIAFSNAFPFSRGYVEMNFRHMMKVGVNYHLPLCYPDVGWASIVYLLRLRANLFYDHTRAGDYTATRLPYSRDFRSAGAELFFDTKWWNQQPVTFGIRYARLLDNPTMARGPNRWSFILPVNLIGR